MTYSAVYCALIEKRRQHALQDSMYGEVHHVIPKSEGGDDSKENLVRLSAREHYIAHLLLAKIYDDCAMYCAITMMKNKTSNMSRNFRVNSKLYEKLKLHRAKFMSEKLKGNTNGLGYKHTPEQLAKRQEYYKKHGHPSKGKKLSTFIKHKISESCKGHPYNGGGCCKPGLKWWNNGKINVRKRECPPGFVVGRLKKKKQ